LVYGGDLKREYLRSPKAMNVIAGLDRAGRARKVSDSDVDAETTVVRSSGLCKSNDPHVIALARIASVRLLCSLDQNLHTDFTNNKLLSKPKGRVYQNETHAHLIARYCGNK
jgi:hypothetical protein